MAHATAAVPLLTVITICFRNPDDLEATLRSLEGLPDTVERLVIDGSPDDSCARVAAVFPGVRHVQQRDDGKYDAMNKGIAAACGDALLFLNSGDELASTDALGRLLTAHGNRLADAIVYGDCKHRTGGQDVTVPAPMPQAENLRLGRLASHQSTLIPRLYHQRHPYDAAMFFAADTLFLKQAYRDLPSIHFPEPIGIFGHGGASTSPGSLSLLVKQYRELAGTHELTARERASIAFLLARRKLIHLVIGEDRLQRLQAWRLARRNRRSGA